LNKQEPDDNSSIDPLSISVKDKEKSKELMIENFVKGINTLREVLKQELCLSNLYDKYI
jgi:hypothetical protein